MVGTVHIRNAFLVEEFLKSIVPSIKFTYEVEECGVLPFLDVSVHMRQDLGCALKT